MEHGSSSEPESAQGPVAKRTPSSSRCAPRLLGLRQLRQELSALGTSLNGLTSDAASPLQRRAERDRRKGGTTLAQVGRLFSGVPFPG